MKTALVLKLGELKFNNPEMVCAAQKITVPLQLGLPFTFSVEGNWFSLAGIIICLS